MFKWAALDLWQKNMLATLWGCYQQNPDCTTF